MNLKKIILFLSFFFYVYSFSQNDFLVEYSITAKSGNSGTEIFLKRKGEKSLFGKLKSIESKEKSAYKLEKKEGQLFATSNKTKLIYKNFKDEKIVSNERIVLDNFIVEDKISPFAWKILDEEKNILGYKCKKAVTNFRGRDYVVYFTYDIKKSDGPWKLYGLPGLILEAYTKDDYIHFTAININFDTIENLENPFKDDKIDFKSFKDFKNEYQKTYTTLQKGKIREDGKLVTSEIPKGNIEIYID